MANLSSIFKYISHFRHAGHQVGRKVGDMLEVLTYAAIYDDDQLRSRLQVEPKIYGFTGAGHKVEFALNSIPSEEIINGGDLEDVDGLIGFIECKKVGVEQTINSSFRKKFNKVSDKKYRVDNSDTIEVTFKPRASDIKYKYSLSFNGNLLTVTDVFDENFFFQESIENGHRIIFTLGQDNRSEVLGNNASLRDIPYELKSCRILEIYEVHENYVLALLNDCLSGPQTPEKAKQSSFVALDVRKKRFGQFDKRENEQECISVLVLTEFSHWEQKSQNMVVTCIDKVFVIDDALIIQAFEEFEEQFGENFYDFITKENFENNEQVRTIALSIIRQYDGKIFEDLADNQMKALSFDPENNSMIFIS